MYKQKRFRKYKLILGRRQLEDVLYFMDEWDHYTRDLREKGAIGEYWDVELGKDKRRYSKLEQKLRKLLNN